MHTVSVIIAAYNRCEDLKEVLEGLRAQKVDGKCAYEVLVVDNNSTDATRQAMENFLLSILNFYNRRTFLNYYINFFRKIGMISRFRSQFRS